MMANSSDKVTAISRARALNVPTVAHADMLLELLEKGAAAGPNARRLADLYDEAKRVRAAFPAAPKPSEPK